MKLIEAEFYGNGPDGYREVPLTIHENGAPLVTEENSSLQIIKLAHQRLNTTFSRNFLGISPHENPSNQQISTAYRYHLGTIVANSLLETLEGCHDLYDDPQREHHGKDHARRIKKWAMPMTVAHHELFERDNEIKLMAVGVALRFHDIVQLINHKNGVESIRQGHEENGALLTRLLLPDLEKVTGIPHDKAEYVIRLAATAVYLHDSPRFGRTLESFGDTSTTIFSHGERLSPLTFSDEKLLRIGDSFSEKANPLPCNLQDRRTELLKNPDKNPWFDDKTIKDAQDVFEILSFADIMDMVYPPHLALRRTLSGPWAKTRPFMRGTQESMLSALKSLEQEDWDTMPPDMGSDYGRKMIELDYVAKLMEKGNLCQEPRIRTYLQKVILHSLWYLKDTAVEIEENGKHSDFAIRTESLLMEELGGKIEKRMGKSLYLPARFMSQIGLADTIETIREETAAVEENIRSKSQTQEIRDLSTNDIPGVTETVESYFIQRLGIASEDLALYAAEYEEIKNGEKQYDVPYSTYVGTGKPENMQRIKAVV